MAISNTKVIFTAAAIIGVGISLSWVVASPETKTQPITAKHNQVTVKAGDMKQAFSALQQQIHQVSSNIPKQLTKLDNTNKKRIATLRAQVQKQLNHLQKEITQVQSSLVKQMKALQKEVRQQELTR